MSVELLNSYEVLKFTAALGGVDAAGTVTAGVMPEGFVVDGGYHVTADAATNNEVTWGDATDPNRYVDDVDASSGPVRGRIVEATGVGFDPTSLTLRTVIATNTGSAEWAGGDSVLYLIGHYEFDDAV